MIRRKLSATLVTLAPTALRFAALMGLERQNGRVSLRVNVSLNAIVSVSHCFHFFCVPQVPSRPASSLRCTPTINNIAPAATCPPLTVANGKASSTSASKTMETVDITCDDGHRKFGTSATCTPTGPRQVAWKNIPICAGRLSGCLFKNTTQMSGNECLDRTP